MVNASITAVLAGSSGLSLLSYNEHAHLGGVPDLPLSRPASSQSAGASST
ncbi:hypothetical protein ACFSTC_56465 [Nonomuraea ferruginea]